MSKLLSQEEIERRIGNLARRRMPLKERLHMAYALGYDQGSEQQMQMRIRDAQECREKNGRHQ